MSENVDPRLDRPGDENGVTQPSVSSPVGSQFRGPVLSVTSQDDGTTPNSSPSYVRQSSHPRGHGLVVRGLGHGHEVHGGE